MNRTLLSRSSNLAGIALICAIGFPGIGSSYAGEQPTRRVEMKPAEIYHNYCSVCHGDRGDGRSRARASLDPPPRDFTTAAEIGRETMIASVTHGKPGTAMVGWKTQLTDTQIEAVVDYIRQSFMAVALDPRLQRGKVLYAHHCAACHGERGQGPAHPAGAQARSRDLASPQSRSELSRDRMIASVSSGRPGTAMVAFAGRLPQPDIEAVVDYVRAALMVPVLDGISGVRARGGSGGELPGAPAAQPVTAVGADMNLPMPNGLHGNARKGGAFYDANCATCHGAKGDGKGPRAYFINPRPRDFVGADSRANLNRPRIYASTAMGKLGTEMSAWSKVLGEQEIADVAEYVFTQFIRPRGKAAHE